MNEPNEAKNKTELADRLWEQQGKREEHATGDWLEAEYKAHPPIVAAKDEIDLRMRGLGPLTATSSPTNSTQISRPETSTSRPGSLVLVAGVLVGLGVLYSLARRFSS